MSLERKRLLARKMEWEKITLLSAKLGKAESLLRAQSRDLSNEYAHNLGKRAQECDRDFKRALISALETLQKNYNDTNSAVLRNIAG